jgi:hypothetical protein
MPAILPSAISPDERRIADLPTTAHFGAPKREARRSVAPSFPAVRGGFKFAPNRVTVLPSSFSGTPMDASKIFLALVGVVYLALAAWCAIKPETTAQALGLRLDPGAGQSEYFTVYGGLQLAMGLLFLWPFLDATVLPYSLMTCLLIHGSLVLMRSIAFLLFTGIPTTTIGFAALEWIIFLAALALWWMRR